jgi:hypothetical protein
MKLEVGIYVRTNLGIAKIISLEKKHLGNEFLLDKEIIDTHEDYYTSCMYDYKFYLEQIIKTSHNIIDLIEENDYIRIVTSAYFEPVYYSYGKLVIRDDIDISKYTNKFIAEVITHEQMKSMSYKVGE